LPDCFLTYDIPAAKLTLFIPPLNPEEVVWSGLPVSPEEALERYDVDEVRFKTELNDCLVGLSAASRRTVWAIAEQVSIWVNFVRFDAKNFTLLREAIDDCRVVKDAHEIALVRKANQISAAAHAAALRAAVRATNEREIAAVFVERCMALGCREQAYQPIVASGTNAAKLHYGQNDAPLTGQPRLLLLDAGGQFRCYAADITRTFPIGGSGGGGAGTGFTEQSRAVYRIVQRMQDECIAMLQHCLEWEKVHEHAHRVAIDGLLALGILRGGSPQDIFAARTSVAFFPHGLGHYLGLDTHDTGGCPNYADADSMFKYLRVRGTLRRGSIVTVEPGV
jgi:Xaa-Pro dipeptidase